MLPTVALTILTLSAVTSTAIPRKGEYLRDLAVFYQPSPLLCNSLSNDYEILLTDIDNENEDKLSREAEKSIELPYSDINNLFEKRSLDRIGGGALLGKRALDGIGGGALLGKRALDRIGGGALLGKRALDRIGGGALLGKRALDGIGGGALLGKRALDGIGGGALLGKRALDGIGGGALLGKRSLDGIGGGALLGKRALDGIGGGALLGKRALDSIGGGALLGKRSLDGIGGGALLGKRSLDGIGGGALLGKRTSMDEPSMVRRALDGIGGGALLGKRALDSIGGGGLIGKRRLDNFDDNIFTEKDLEEDDTIRIRQEVQPAMERERESSLKKRTYGSLSLGGSYGTAKRGDLSLLKLGSSFGRLARSNIRLDDYGILQHDYDPVVNSYSGNKYNSPRILEGTSIEDFPVVKNVRSRNSGDISMRQFPSEEFDKDD